MHISLKSAIVLGAIAFASVTLCAARESTKETEKRESDVTLRQAAALKFLRGLEASIYRNKRGSVVSISVSCIYGLWDDPEPRTKWLPQFAGHLQAFPKLNEVSVFNWVYEDDDLRHLAMIPQLTSFSNDTMFGKAPPFTGSGLKHLVMPAKMSSLTISGKGITDSSLAHVALLGRLRNIHIYSGNVTDKGLQHLEALDLQVLRLHTGRITSDGLKHLSEMKDMQTLSLSSNRIGDRGLVHLSAMHKLKELELGANQITDAGLEHLAELKELRKLDLSGNNICGPGVRNLSGLVNLETLVFAMSPELNDSVLEPLVALPKLRYVGISESKVKIDALRRFRKRRPKVKLSFSARSAYGLDDKWSLTLDEDWRIRKVSFRERANDDDLTLFARNPELAGVEYILFPSPQDVTGKGLVHLQTLKGLKTLILDECMIGNEGMKAIGCMTQLERLEIDEGGITGIGLAHLAGLKKLRYLELTNMGLVNDDLMHLGGITNLRFLSLAGNKITEKGAAMHLKGAKQLRHLNISADTYRGAKIFKGDEVKRLLK